MELLKARLAHHTVIFAISSTSTPRTYIFSGSRVLEHLAESKLFTSPGSTASLWLESARAASKHLMVGHQELNVIDVVWDVDTTRMLTPLSSLQTIPRGERVRANV